MPSPEALPTDSPSAATPGPSPAAPAPHHHSRHYTRAYLLLAAATIFWSGNLVIARGNRNELSPSALVFWRWAIALACLLPFTGREIWRRRRELRAQWKFFAVLGGLGVFAYPELAYRAVKLSPAVNVYLIMATGPLITALINRLFFRQPLAPRVALGIALSFLGVLTFLCHGHPTELHNFQFNAGDLIMLANMVVWGFYCILLQRYRPPDWSPLALTAVTILAGLLFASPVYLLSLAHGDRFTLTPVHLLALGYIGVFSSVLAYVCWNEGVVAGDSTLAAFFFNLLPVFGIMLSVYFLHESFAAYHAVGALFVLAGILLGREPAASPKR